MKSVGHNLSKLLISFVYFKIMMYHSHICYRSCISSASHVCVFFMQCIRCLRQTSAFASPGSGSSSNQNEKETWWISRWAYGCPMCGGTWVRVV